MVPPRLPKVFINAETEPANSPPISKVSAQETPTVISRPNITTPENKTLVTGFELAYAGHTPAAASKKPPMATMRLDLASLPELFAHRSEIQPPTKSPSVPAI